MSNYWWLIVGVVVVLSVALLRTYRKSVYQSRSYAGYRQWARSIEQANQQAGKLLYEQLVVMVQFGEMLDHTGVALEQGQFPQESADLKELGRILRSMLERDSPWELSWCQNTLVILGDRYGIEPISGGQYSLQILVRIAEEIMERVIDKQAALAAQLKGDPVMTEAVAIEDPSAVINALTARVKELERSNEYLKNELGRYVELPRETKELLGIMRMREVIPLYLGSKNYDALKQDFVSKGPAALEAFEQVWFLDNAPVSTEVKDSVRKAADHGMSRW